MEPRIQFARCSDDVNIAYYEIGEGTPVVHTPGSITNIQTEWQEQGKREWYEHLAAYYRVIRYDRRGTGLSDRNVSDYSVGALQRDIEAVVDHIGVDQFGLFASGWSGPAAIAIAASHPDRVSRMVLYGTNPSGVSTLLLQDDTARYLLDSDWELFTELLARQAFEWPDSGRVRAEAARIRESITQEGMRSFLEAARTWDASELLTQVRCPTMVIYRPQWAVRGGQSSVAVERTRAMAQSIAGAELVTLAGSELAPYLDTGALLHTLAEFFGGGRRVKRGEAPHGTAIILFTDIANSTALTERMGDDAFREASRGLDERCRAMIRDCGGTPVTGNVLGDGVMAVFSSARQAIDAAQQCHVASDETGLLLHIGVHAGDVISEADNVYGGAVNIAARIAGECVAGETLVSATVRDLARTSAGVVFEDRGDVMLKGVSEAQRVYAVRQREVG